MTMELKISVKENNVVNDKGVFLQSQTNICAISCENVVAFTRVVFRSNNFKQTIPIYTIYTADLNSLFEPHVIMESLDPILKLKFSQLGHHLLIVTTSRQLQLYTKGVGIHQWTNSHSFNWGEEELLHVDFFHMNKEPYIQHGEVNINGSYSEKFQCRSHQSSLQSIGNCPQNGFFAITASGLFLACTINSSGLVETEGKAVLGPVRDHFSSASAAFDPDGHIHLAAWKQGMVKCWEIELRLTETERLLSSQNETNGNHRVEGPLRKLEIRVVSTLFFSPVLLTSEEKPYKVINVTHICFSDLDDPTSLLLFIEADKEAMNINGNIIGEQDKEQSSTKEDSDFNGAKHFIQRYKLQKKTRPLFQFFPQSSPGEKSVATAPVKEWACLAEWMSPQAITSISNSCFAVVKGFSFPSICVAMRGGSIFVVNKETLQQVSKSGVQWDILDGHSGKGFSKDKMIVSMATTWTNLHLLAQDSRGGLHVFSFLKQSDLACTWLIYLVVLLEYSLVSEYDCCDILMAIPPSSALNIAERLNENFFQHPNKIVANLLTKFLVLKNSILRISSHLHQKSIEARIQAQLSAILKLFHAFRPVTSDAANVEKNFYATIHAYIESRASFEVLDIDKSIDNLLYNYNILDFQIDPSLCQDLQILLEFSTDLALYLLLLLVQNSKYELQKEPKTLQYLREILFVSRIWYKYNKLVSPQVIKMTDTIDIWAQIYKLLTRLALIVPNEPDTLFLDDCIMLETQILCREIPLFIPPRGVLGCLASSSPAPPQYPLQFQYNQQDPNPSISNVNPRPLEGSLASPQPLDPLYYRFLGLSVPHWQCTRCFAMRGSWWGANEFSMLDQEWSSRCFCSGQWAPTQSRTSTLA